MKFGYTIIYVPDTEKALQFYENAFGFKIKFLHESKVYGELETGNTTLAFVQESLASANVGLFEKNNKNKPSAGIEIAFVTQDVKKAYQQALKAGAQALKEPLTAPWGQEVAYVKDLNGVIIELCSPMS
jgi:uncharacterized glyoxalase superfamily protein PhnB